MDKLIVILDYDKNLYLYQHHRTPKLLAKKIDNFSMLDKRIAIIKNKTLYTHGESTTTGSLGTSYFSHPIFLKVDDDVLDVVLEKNCLRYKKNDGKTFYCGSGCQIKQDDTIHKLPTTEIPLEYLSTNETDLSYSSIYGASSIRKFNSLCQYEMTSWTSFNRFFLKIFDGNLYFRSSGAYSDTNTNKGELVMTDVSGIYDSY